jgi:hypothetical protein
MASLNAISLPIPTWIERVRKEWEDDPVTASIIQQLEKNVSSIQGFSWQGGVLRFREKVDLCKNSNIKEEILKEVHASSSTRLKGFLKTYHREKQSFFWEGIKKDIKLFVEK